VSALGTATWRVTYTCGDSGLPVGGAVKLRRWPLSLDWSKPQDASPREAGYVRAAGSAGVQWQVGAGGLQDITFRLGWPALRPGERAEFIIGDTGGGGAGMRVQGKPARIEWLAESDCDADGKFAAVAEVAGGGFAVVPGAPRQAVVVAPVTAEVGRPVALAVEVLDEAGNVVPAAKAREAGLGASLRLSAEPRTQGLPASVQLPAEGRAACTVEVTLDKPGALGLRVANAAGLDAPPARILVSRRTGNVPDGAGEYPRAYIGGDVAVIENQAVRMVFARNPTGAAAGQQAYGYAAVYVRQGDRWAQVAALPSLGRVIWAGVSAGKAQARLYADAAKASREGGRAELVLTGALETPRGRRWPLSARFSLGADQKHVEAEYGLRAASAEPLLAFYGPELLAGEGSFAATRRGALFPGLEYLTADEVSSDDEGVAWQIRERWVPHPYKITVPLMAVSGALPTGAGAADGTAAVGLMWDPLQRWDGTHQVPLARFASPDRPERRPNHLMALFVPFVPESFKENLTQAAEPWTPAAGTRLKVAAQILAMGGAGDVTDAVDYWARHRPLPAPDPPRSWQEELALCARGYMQTGYDAAHKGWIAAMGQAAQPSPYVADRLLMAAGLSGDAKLAAAAREQVAAVMGPVMGGTEHSLRSGNPAWALDALRNGAYGAMSGQHAEGSWAFSQVYATDGDRATLANPDDVALGTCVSRLWPIWQYALATGDPKAVAAGELGLRYIERFTKPSGAESWEVPLVCPNLRAAALAVNCYAAAYQVTGRQEYLARARYWARAGLAFIYLWRAPDRPVMPGASISVMGTTFFSHPWFGAAVQWVGLTFAESLQELARLDDSLAWRRVAELIAVSASRQQKAPGAPCGHVGYYPDSYNVAWGKDYYEWCLDPSLLVDNVLGMEGLPPTFATTVARDGDLAVHITTVATVASARASAADGTVTATLRYLPGQACNALVLGLAAPESVEWQGEALPPLRDFGAATDPGWYFDGRQGCLELRLGFAAAAGTLVLRGVKALAYQAPGVADRTPNGGFEQGLTYWQVEPGGALDTAHPHSGQAALALECMEAGREVQATSEAMSVEGGREYRLRSYVWQAAGDGSYKVTLDWRNGAGAHIRYDNDWQGTNRPAAYTEHGGVFVAPRDAAMAILILGVRDAKCLFDDVSLAPAG
jgi:hypothetical protein